MKKYYKFGEMILALREEYQECKHILDELKDCINVKSDTSKIYFTGSLSSNDKIQDLSDRSIILCVEKKYLDILKKIQYLKHDLYGQFLYSAFFAVNKKDNDSYGLEYDDMFTPVNIRKYIPEVQIVDQAKFSEVIDELFSTDLMQLKRGIFRNNHDRILLNFDSAYISTSDASFIRWNGINDNFDYSINRCNFSPLIPNLIEGILLLEIPADKISSDWLKILEKHEIIFDRKLLFQVDVDVRSKKGILGFSDVEDKGVVKILEKVK